MASQLDGGIAWCDETWNPVIGCSRVSEGCRHCYAEKTAWRFAITAKPGKTPRYRGLVESTPHGARWTGEVRLVESVLDAPLRWKRPRRIFVNSMGDLFHEKVPDERIDKVFAVMALAPQHTFQVLTKRPQRMLDYIGRDPANLMHRWWLASTNIITLALRHGDLPFPRVPLKNVWLGVSVEDQPTADERIPILLQTPAAVRWVSYEPALGEVRFAKWLPIRWDAYRQAWQREREIPWVAGRDGLAWIVVGGESGPGARPFDLAWARSTIAQGKAAGVPVFVKQLGAKPRGECPWPHHHESPPVWLDDDGVLPSVSGNPATDLCHSTLDGHGPCALKLRDRKGGDPAEWPEDLRVREYPR